MAGRMATSSALGARGGAAGAVAPGYRRGVSEPDVDESPESAPRRLPVRRSPRYGAFLVTGAGVGVLLAVVLALSGSADADTGRGQLLGYLALLLGLLGGVLGGLAAVCVEWKARRRNRHASRTRG